MLAYTVWHHASDELNTLRYQESLLQFHQTMAELKPQGYQSSLLFTMPGVPWMGEERTVFMDWYFVENSSSLDFLNDAVLDGKRKQSHDAVAGGTSGGVTALYQPKLGNDKINEINFITWISKPKGMSYRDFFRELNFIQQDNDASCWMRYMALGPGPEFCVVSNDEFEWDEMFQPLIRTAVKTWG
jgi:hypothetical protein